MNPSKQTRRWLVHLGLITTAVTSLVFEFILTLHILFGLVFVAFVAAHIAQRRRTSSRLVKRLAKLSHLNESQGRLAITDFALALVTAGMLTSGLLDWSLGHPTLIRYHALLGVALLIFLVVHSATRWKRIRRSHVR